MKNTHLVVFAPLALLAALMLTACPPSKPSDGGMDTTNVDSVTPPPTPDYGSAVITLDRSTCFGKCPSYSLKVDGSGKVSYEGRKFVAVMGPQSSQITIEAIKGLVDDFLKIDYFALQDSFTSDITDVPDYTTSLTIDGKTKTVFDRDGAPSALRELEDKIDQVTNSAQWVNAADK